MAATGGVRLVHRALGVVRSIAGSQPLIVLKGIAYGLYLYRRPVHRASADLDVLVPMEAFAEVNRNLLEAGYERTYPFGRIGRHPGYPESNFWVDGVLVEVHHSLTQRSRHTIPYDRIFDRSVPLEQTAGCRRMADLDAFLSHCTGLAKEHFEVRLSHWLDLWLLMQRLSEIEVSLAIRRAREWSTLRAVLSSLRALPHYIPEACSHQLVRDALESKERALNPMWILRARTGKRHDQIRRKFAAMDSARRRLAFLTHHAWMNLTAGLYPDHSRALARRRYSREKETRRH